MGVLLYVQGDSAQISAWGFDHQAHRVTAKEQPAHPIQHLVYRMTMLHFGLGFAHVVITTEWIKPGQEDLYQRAGG